MTCSADTSPGHAVLQRPAWGHEDPSAQASLLTSSSCWAALCAHARKTGLKGTPVFKRSQLSSDSIHD